MIIVITLDLEHYGNLLYLRTLLFKDILNLSNSR